MKSILCLGVLLLVGQAHSRSPFFSTDTEEVDSAEHGGPAGRRGTTCPCGWANKDSQRIVGGRETRINEYPFQVALIDKTRMFQFCGGTILTPYHVLTAAHCTIEYVQQGGPGEILVIAGDHDLSTVSDTRYSQMVAVRSINQHILYNHQLIMNDVSVLLLASPLQFNQFVGPACISPVQMNLDEQYVRVIGWGRISQTGPASRVLRKVDLRVVPLNKCAARYPNILPSMRSQICAHADNKGGCMGDSGGPLVWLDPETNRYTVVGIVSFGRICGSTDPSVFTDASAFYGWIQMAIKSTAPVSTCSKK